MIINLISFPGILEIPKLRPMVFSRGVANQVGVVDHLNSTLSKQMVGMVGLHPCGILDSFRWWNSLKGRHFLATLVHWIQVKSICWMVNIYALQQSAEKMALWDDLPSLKLKERCSLLVISLLVILMLLNLQKKGVVLIIVILVRTL